MEEKEKVVEEQEDCCCHGEKGECSCNHQEDTCKCCHSKKRGNGVLIIVLFSILIVASCIGTFLLLREDKKELSQEKEKEDTTILFTKETLPRVDASLATQPLMDAFILNFTGKTTSDMGVEYTNTHPGYVKLINNEADLLIVTEPSKEELALAQEKGIELEVTKVVNEGFVFFTNAESDIDSLTFEQIQGIYAGEITNWKEVGGKDATIVAFQRPVNSGSQTGLLSLVMKGKEVKAPTPTEKIQTMEGIIDYVADYDNGKDAIGYSYYYYAETMYKNDHIKYIGVNGVKPTDDTIRDGSYPILSGYYIVTRKGETNENVAKLKEAMLSNRGQKVAGEAGYVSLK